MSDKIFMKDITLPIVETGEDETYSFVQTDDDLETAGDAADAKKTGDEISALKQEYNQVQALANAAYVTETIIDAAIASFSDGADNIPVKSLTVDIDPVQDLHGQANPYPGGGGKNKLATTVDGLKSANTTGTWSGMVYTVGDVAFTILADSDENVTGIKVNGTASANIYFDFVSSFDSSAFAGMVFSGLPNTTPAGMTVRISSGNRTSLQELYPGDTTISDNGSSLKIAMRVATGTVVSNITVTPMIRQSGASSDFMPYSNICPISGWTGANVSVNGVNQWDEEWEVGAIDHSTGQNSSNSAVMRSKNYIPVVANTGYYVTHSLGGLFMHYYDGAKNFLSYNFLGSDDHTFTTPSNAVYARFSTNTEYGATYLNDISINYPSTDTSYHAYNGEVYEVDWTTESGTVYGGTLDVTSGVLTVTHAIKEFDGTETIQIQTSTGYRGFNNTFASIGINDADISEVSISSHCVELLSGYSNKNFGYIAFYLVNGAPCWIFTDNGEQFADVTAFKTYLAAQKTAGTPVQMMVKLATPVTYQLDETAVNTILGQNNIFCDAGNIAELTYRADLKAYIDAHVGM